MHRISRRLTIAAALASLSAAKVKPDPRLFAEPNAPVLGNPSGRLTIAEFFDYRCPFCRRMYPAVTRLLEEDRDIRFVAMNWPILGPASTLAARTALAANWQGRFAQVHAALFTLPRKLEEATVREAAASAGVDMQRLDRDLAQRADALGDMLGDVALDAASLGLQGTPALVVGSYLVRGALSYADLRDLVGKARRPQTG